MQRANPILFACQLRQQRQGHPSRFLSEDLHSAHEGSDTPAGIVAIRAAASLRCFEKQQLHLWYRRSQAALLPVETKAKAQCRLKIYPILKVAYLQRVCPGFRAV